MSKEVIKILDTFAEKFGIAIDWTSVNVLPYLQQLYDKCVMYEIVTSVIWILLGICLLFVGKYLIRMMKYCWKKYKEDWASDCDIIAIGLGVFAGLAIVGGIIIILCQIFDIVTCITFPEKIIIRELQLIYSNLKEINYFR